MRTWWAAQAWLPDGVADRVRISVRDGMITGVDANTDPGPGDTRLPGLAMPGMANAHSHAFHRALRGRTHADGGTFWTWRDRMYALAARLTPDSYHALARALFAEVVSAGYTAVGEFHYLHHDTGGTRYTDPNAMGEAVLAAAAEAGLRITLLDTCYLRGGLTADGHTDPDPVQRRYADRDVEDWATRVADLQTRPRSGCALVGAAVHSVRAVPADDLAAVATACRALDLPAVHAHVSEQPAENAACAGHYGLTPTGLLAAAGLLDTRFTAVHATHLSSADIAALAGAGSTVCVCPTTERDLADGIGPARDLADAGVRLCVGSDQHVQVDPFAELQGLEGHDRLLSLRRGRFTPSALVEAGTRDSYTSLGWDGGRLSVGGVADLIAVHPASTRTAGALPDQLPLAASATDVTDVIVAGEHVVRAGAHRLGDVGALLERAIRPLWTSP